MLKKILKQNILLTITKLVSKLSLVFVISHIARNETIENFGNYTLYLSIISVLATFGDFGTNTLIYKNRNQKEKIQEYFDFRFILFYTSSIIFLVIVFINNIEAPYLLLIYYFLNEYIFQFCIKYYESNGTYSISLISVVIERLIFFSFYILLNLFYRPIISFMLANLLSTTIVVLHFYYINNINLSFLKKRQIIDTIWRGKKYFIIAFVSVLMNKIEIFLFKIYGGSDFIASFRTMNQIVESIQIFILSLSGTFLYNYINSSNKQTVIRSYTILTILIFIFMLPLLYIFSANIYSVLYDNKYFDMVSYFRIYLLVLPFYLVSAFVGSMLLVNGLEGFVLTNLLLSLIFKLVVYSILIPNVTYLNVVIVIIVSEVISNIYQIFIYIRKVVNY